MRSRPGGELRRKVLFGIGILVLIVSHIGDVGTLWPRPGWTLLRAKASPPRLDVR